MGVSVKLVTETKDNPPVIRLCMALASIFLLAASAVAAATVGSPAATPSSIPVNTPTAVLFTAVLADPSVIPGSVNLQRLDANGTTFTFVGQLYDDGTHGDAVAGDFTYSLQLTLTASTPFPITFRVSAAVRGSLTRIFSHQIVIGVSGVTPTVVTLTSPPNLAFLNSSPVTVSGTVSDPAAIVTVNGIAAPPASGMFSVAVPLIEGNNTLTAVATSALGVASSTSVQVTLDTVPPRVTILSPPNGFVTTDPSINVTGTVNDVVVGTVNNQQATVGLNGIAAQVANRNFQALNVPLALGNNTITATGTDRAGNSATATIGVQRQSAAQPRILIVSGNNQRGPVNSTLPAPLKVSLVDAAGNPLFNRSVTFTVTQNNGTLDSGLVTETFTNVSQAQVLLTLGARAGAGGNTVTVTGSGFSGAAVFSATGLAGNPAQISVDAGNGQSGTIGQALPLPFVVVVSDAAYNRLANVPVTFTVVQGGGNFGGQNSVTAVSDGDGRALAILKLGPQDGVENNLASATFAGSTGLPAVFSATGRSPGNPAATRISGVVLDNSGSPIAGVTIRAYLTNVPALVSAGIPPNVSVQTDVHGQFLIQPAPVGFVKLIADGSTVQRIGSWPNLEYDLVTVAGQNNSVGVPIYLLPLDTQDQLCVTPTSGGTLTLPQTPGFSLTVLPGSATFPGGSNSGCVSVTTVHTDKIPMAPGFGQQPSIIVTIQPAGTLFNPPAAISFPNAGGLSPRQTTEFYSFDHDIGAFVSIGTATVSDDGTVVRSDRGVGVLKAGWASAGSLGPPPTGCVGVCPECQLCNCPDCVPDLALDGNRCSLGVCRAGQCMPLSVSIEADYIDKDDPSTASSQLLPLGQALYAGSAASTSDSLTLIATPGAGSPAVASYTWTDTSPGALSFTAPASSASAQQWSVGSLVWPSGLLGLTPAGKHTFKVAANFVGGGYAEATRVIEVGVRTDDTIVVGWINPNGVSLPAGANTALTALFSPPPVPSSLQCNAAVGLLAFHEVPTQGSNPPQPLVVTQTDSVYVLNWLFKFAANPDPVTVISGGTFSGATSFTDEAKVSDYLADPTNFKLFNRLQVKFIPGPNGVGFATAPTVLHKTVAIGTTHNPCGTAAGFFSLFPGQAGPANGLLSNTNIPTTHISLINDGSPDANVVEAFNFLVYHASLPGFWEDIGSKISFSPAGPSATIDVQTYPTYYIYKNGSLAGILAQAGAPLDNFQPNPYPFGTAACIRSFITVPGGRCGDATQAPAGTARTPVYVIP